MAEAPHPAHRYRESDPRRRLILALDVASADAAKALVEPLADELVYVKVGMELYTAVGPSVVRELIDAGLHVFLDLKFHDIPNTMAGGVRSAAALGARLCTVHASAAKGVIAAAQAAAEDSGAMPPAILAVTVLTSHGPEELPKLFGTELSGLDLVVRLGEASIAAGATGLVASPMEINALRHALGPDPLLVIPGIRPTGSEVADQARVATPATALAAGADFLVVGRPISQSPDPAGALSRILDEMAAAM